jgi:DNA invertase Pin-like site-specific DNA recombinase
MKKFVTYRRVSTQEQGRSGLGLEAQTRDISSYLEHSSGEPHEIIGAFVDILSGADDSRPELLKAIALAKKYKAVLLVAKLDRLSRKVSYIASLMEDKAIQFKVANLPQADNFQLHLYAALAEQERSFISQRTKAALAVAKTRGVALGGLRDKTNERNKVRSASALTHAQSLEKLVVPMRLQGRSFKAIGEALNAAHVKAATGGLWSPIQVSRVLHRLS